MTFTLPIVLAVLLGLSQMLKVSGIPKKVLPWVNLALGMGAAFSFVPGDTIQVTVFYGLALGLSANGMFDLTKISKK